MPLLGGWRINLWRKAMTEVRTCPWCLEPTDEPHCPQPECHAAVPRTSRDVVPREDSPFHGLLVDWRYRVTRRIGEGGFGSIYRAYDRFADMMVAIKFLCSRPDDEVSEKARQRLEHEAAVLGRLRHPHIVRMYDVENLREGPPCLVMELLDGHDLETELGAHRRRSARQAIEWLIPVCEALQYAHQRDILHLDIKPSNLFLHRTADGKFVLKVLDFGISRLRGTRCVRPAQESEPMMVYGTPHYMSPEVAQGSTPGPTSDLYSLGVLLYEMLAGSPPFAGVEDHNVMSAHVLSSVPPLPPDPEIPTELRDLVGSLLEKKPRRRPQTAREVAERLRQIREELPASDIAPTSLPADRSCSPSAPDTVPLEMP